MRMTVDFGIITIREDEFEAVLERFPEEIGIVSGRREYNLRRLAPGDPYTVAIVRCAAQGNGEAQQVANALLDDLSPRWLLVVGIGGAAPAFERTLGDVVVSTEVVDFSVGAVLKDGSHEYALQGWVTHAEARKHAANLPALRSHLGAWNSPASIRAPRPEIRVAPKSFYGDARWKKTVRKTLEHHLAEARSEPRATAGAIACSDLVMKDAELFDVWLKITRQVIAVEMESAGIHRAASERHVPFLSIRGLSDVVGLVRDPRWTAYACHSAAAFTRAFLLTRPLPPDGDGGPGISGARRMGSPPGSPAGGTTHTSAARGPAPLMHTTRAPTSFEGPRGPARPIENFLARHAEMETLRSALAENAHVCVVGLGGVGKTSLVRQFVATHAKTRFPDGVGWIDAMKLTADISRVAQRFGLNDVQIDDVRGMNRWLATRLDDLDVLLVIDNVDHDEVRLDELPLVGGRSRTVLISRSLSLHKELDEPAFRLVLHCWTPEVCRSYFRQVAEELAKIRDEDLDGLARFVGYLPLAVRLLAKRLARSKETPLAVLALLEREPVGTLDQTAQGYDRGVAATFKGSFDRLDDLSRRVLVALASSARATRSAVVGGVAGISEQEVEWPLSCLRDACLVDYADGSDQPWCLHDLVRHFVRQQRGVDDADAAHLAFVRHQLSLGRERSDQTARDLDMSEVLAAVDRLLTSSSGAAAAWELLSSVAKRLKQMGRYIELFDRARRIVALLPPTSLDLGHALNRLGLTYHAFGKQQEAIECHERGLQICEARSDQEREARQLAVKHLGNLGLCYRRRNLRKAIEYHERALELHHLLGTDPRGLARQLGNLGLCYRVQGEPLKAASHHERALQIHSSCAADEKAELEGQAKQLANLAECYRELDRTDEAIAHFQRSLEICKKLRHRPGEATQMNNIGRCYQKLGETSKAVEYITTSLRMQEELKRPVEKADSLSSMGQCHHALGNVSEAIHFHTTSLDLYRAMDDIQGQAQQHQHLGLCAEAVGDQPGALEHLSDALRLWRELGAFDTSLSVRTVLAGLDRLRERQTSVETPNIVE